MQILKIRAVAGTAHLVAGSQLFRQLDLDDVSPPIGELTHTRRAGANPRQIEDSKPAERRGSGIVRHNLALLLTRGLKWDGYR